MHEILTLPRAQAHTLRCRPGDRLVVLEGRLWVTQASDAQDYFLGTGDSLVARRDALVIEADRCPLARYRVVRNLGVLYRGLAAGATEAPAMPWRASACSTKPEAFISST